MAFEIFRPVSSPGWPLFDVRQDYRTSGFGSCEVSIEVVHVDEDTVDNPRHRRPLAGLLAHFAMVFRTAVLGCRRRKHDQSVSRLHLAVCQLSIGRRETRRLSKAERAAQPFQSRDPILIGDHRNDRRRVGSWPCVFCSRRPSTRDRRLAASRPTLPRGGRFRRCRPTLPGDRGLPSC